MKRINLSTLLCLSALILPIPQLAIAGATKGTTNLVQNSGDIIFSPGNEQHFSAVRKAVRSDKFVTRNDARRGLKFQVPGKGTYELLEIKSAKAGQECRMHLPSLVRALKAQPGGDTEGPQWINLSIYTINGKTHCFWPPNGACYAMTRLATP